jgi:hypothetical protein
MDHWMLALGLAVLVVTAYDAVTTVVAPWAGGGPLTSRLARGWWRAAHRIARRPDSPVLAWAGPAVLLGTIVVWLVLVWGGWTLVLASEPGAVVSDPEGLPADLAGRAYFAGFTVFTLGVGDLVPEGAPWRLVTVVASASGLALTTAAITYLTPVLSAVVERRTQAATIASLGSSPQELVLRAYHDGSLRILEPLLVQLGDDLGLTAERHLAYPVLHQFHPRAPAQDLRARLADLDDALTVIRLGVDDARVDVPHPMVMASAQEAIDQLVDRGSRRRDRVDPRPLELGLLRAAGVPVIAQEEFEHRLAAERDRRERLAAYAAESAWTR